MFQTCLLAKNKESSFDEASPVLSCSSSVVVATVEPFSGTPNPNFGKLNPNLRVTDRHNSKHPSLLFCCQENL
jgi:hypothetical protein